MKNFFKEDKDFTPVKFFENALDGANVYVLKVGEQYVGAYEVGDNIDIIIDRIKEACNYDIELYYLGLTAISMIDANL